MNAAAALPDMVANLVKPTKYVGSTDCAKMIRQALKEAYPEIKFSVVTDKYSGGSSIRVKYQGEAPQKEVEAIAKAFQGGSFDGMTDCQGVLRKTMNGQPTSFGVTFVFVDRLYDENKLRALAALFEQAREITAPAEQTNVVANLAIKMGVEPSDAFRAADYDRCGYSLARAAIVAQDSPKFKGRKSKLADSVVYLSDSNDRND